MSAQQQQRRTVSYGTHLAELADQLEGEARRASTHQLYGLADLLREAAQSAASWAEGYSEWWEGR